MYNFRPLNLPTQPFKDPSFSDDSRSNEWTPVPPDTSILLPVSILSDELLSLFSLHNLEPTHCVMFCANSNHASQEQRVLHTDIAKINGAWEKLYCGVNYELNGSSNRFSWWGTTLTESYPPLSWTKINPKLMGIHYNERNQRGIDPETTHLIEEVEIAVPTLVRTDIPHMVTFNSPHRIRKALSIRFKENWNTWEEAVKSFLPLIKN